MESFKIKDVSGYSPEIGRLVSMMNYARYTTLNAVRGLSIEQLDFLQDDQSNSIGALLFHIAAVEFGFQCELFEGRLPNKEETDEWLAAYELGALGRKDILGNPLSFYTDKLEQVRERTLKAFQKRDDQWLYEERMWSESPSNNYFIWFHTFEDEINHRGQISWLRKRLPRE